MAQAQSVANDQLVTSDMNRYVWVLNNHHEDYVEDFRGDKITVPANREKIAKPFTSGGNLMQFLAARKFLGQPKTAGHILPNGVWFTPPKALETVELTQDEKLKYDAKNAAKVEAEEEETTPKKAKKKDIIEL